MTWDNLDQSVKDELVSKSIRIVGTDTFTLLGDLTGADPVTNPADKKKNKKKKHYLNAGRREPTVYFQSTTMVLFTRI